MGLLSDHRPLEISAGYTEAYIEWCRLVHHAVSDTINCEECFSTDDRTNWCLVGLIHIAKIKELENRNL